MCQNHSDEPATLPSVVVGQTKATSVSGDEDVLLLHHCYLADPNRFYAVVVDDDDEEVVEPEAEFVWVAVSVAVRVFLPVAVSTVLIPVAVFCVLVPVAVF